MELAQDPAQWWSQIFEILTSAANDIQFFHIWIFYAFFSHFPSYMTSVYFTILYKSRRTYLPWHRTLNCWRNAGQFRLIVATINSQIHPNSIPVVQHPKTHFQFYSLISSSFQMEVLQGTSHQTFVCILCLPIIVTSISLSYQFVMRRRM
jgi:hypothetical protein